MDKHFVKLLCSEFPDKRKWIEIMYGDDFYAIRELWERISVREKQPKPRRDIIKDNT